MKKYELENSLILLEQELQNNNRKVTSKFIAEYFSKQHKHILSDVRESNEIYEKLDLPKIRPIFLK